MNNHVILVDDDTANNVFNEDLIRRWNADLDISIIDNSNEVLRFFNREFSNGGLPTVNTKVFINELIPTVVGMDLIDYLQRMHILNNKAIEIYCLSDKGPDKFKCNAFIKKSIKRVLPKQLSMDLLDEILRA